MQLAKLLHPRPRTIGSKLIEMFRAIQIESTLSKEAILEAYLTIAPYGGNIEGIVASSLRYFGKKPYALSYGQMALLVALPQSPERYRPDRHPKQSQKARDRVLEDALENKAMSLYSYTHALKEALPQRLYPLPRYMPHLSENILAKLSAKAYDTTLNAKVQIALEQWAKTKSRFLGKDTTLAVLVAKNSDATIQAYVGSHDRFSTSVSGYVDMIKAIRSPASTLKPFIYAYGFEKHIIHPNTIILDEETRFGDYMPYNFSKDYTGEIRIGEALQYSLNIPAVKVLQKVGVEDFVQRLSTLSGKLFIPKDKATLPIALGGIGLSIWQLTQLYVALGNEGKAYGLQYLSHTKERKMKQLFD
ncbi:MAG: transglycosylase domain-containing protein [Sulfurovum sp.]|nr:transglycosylase domain-containing protein [Sulfurovum sp.]